MQEKRMQDEFEIDLRELWGILLHWLWLIIICAVLAGAAGFAVSRFLMTPIYNSTTKIIVLSKDDDSGLEYSDLQLSTQLGNDYPEIIKSRHVLEQVIENCNLNTSYAALYNRVTITSSTSSRIISITVKDEQPDKAKEIADEIREVAAVRIKEIMNIEAVNMVDAAYLPKSPSSPSVIKYTLIAFILGGIACAGILVVRYLLDDTIKTTEDIEKYLELSALGMIPDGEHTGKTKKKKKTVVADRHASEE